MSNLIDNTVLLSKQEHEDLLAYKHNLLKLVDTCKFILNKPNTVEAEMFNVIKDTTKLNDILVNEQLKTMKNDIAFIKQLLDNSLIKMAL